MSYPKSSTKLIDIHIQAIDTADKNRSKDLSEFELLVKEQQELSLTSNNKKAITPNTQK